MSDRLTPRQRITDQGFAAGWRVVRALPEPVAATAFRVGAELAVRRNGRSVRQLRRNLARVVGAADVDRLDALVRAGMRSYARYWRETFRLPAMNAADVVSRVHCQGTERIHEAAAAGRGLILALPHSGNWDVAGLWLVAQGYPFVTVAERLRPESLYDRFVAYRESLGMRVLPLTGGPVPPMSALKEVLAEGGVVCLVADRDLSRSGLAVDFFGAPARMPAGPSLLAATTGAALLPVHPYYRGADWGLAIAPAVDLGDGDLRRKLRTGTQRLADVFADGIARHPEDWHMVQRLWSDAQDEVGPPAEPSVPGEAIRAAQPSGLG
jgi:KDO2-lipid IV(A) lauroyltransferase